MSCVAELVRLGNHQDELAEVDLRVVAISTDDVATTNRGRDRFALPFTFVADPEHRVAIALGLLHSGGKPGGADIFYATTFLLDGSGIVRWVHVANDVRDRATPELLLDAARSLQR